MLRLLLTESPCAEKEMPTPSSEAVIQVAGGFETKHCTTHAQELGLLNIHSNAVWGGSWKGELQ